MKYVELEEKNWKRILELLKELETHKDFYIRSLTRVSKEPTKENYAVFQADSKVMHDAERELHRLSKFL
jgi:hypothetical protein